jgi:hypothetical protein
VNTYAYAQFSERYLDHWAGPGVAET